MQSGIAAIVSRRAAPFWTVFALALAVRLAHYVAMRENDPLFGVLLRGGDNHEYHRWAIEIAQTFWLGWDRVPFTQGPLYPYFLGMGFLRFGSAYSTAVLLQHFLGACTCVLVFSTTLRVFGRFEAWLAALMAVFCPIFLLYEGEILAETLVLFVNVAALRLLLWAHDRQAAADTAAGGGETFIGGESDASRSGRLRLWWRWLTAGLMLGLCVTARPNALLFVPVALFWILTAGSVPRKRAGTVCMLMLGVVLAIMPVTAANYFGGGEFVLVSKNGSWNLYIGNAYDSTGTYARPHSMWAVVFDEQANEADINWTPHLIASIREHPTSLPRLLWTKTRLFWQSGEVPHVANFYLKRSFSPFLRVPLAFGVVAPLGLVGIVFAFSIRLRRWSDGAVLLLLYLAVYSASIILVFVLSRLRLPALAVLIVFASAALAAALRGAGYGVRALLRGEHRAASAFAVVPLAVAVGWAGLGFALRSPDDGLLIRWADHYNLATGYELGKRYAEALREYEAAIERAPALAPRFEESMQFLRGHLDTTPTESAVL